MIRLLVLYGHPEDPEAFEKHYQDVHMPLAKKIKGLKKLTIGKVLGTPDGSPAPYYRVADVYAESPEALGAVMSSPEGQAAVEDIPNFATGGATFLLTEIEEAI